MAATKIVFLDDDPVIRIVRLVLQNAERDPWIADFFSPEDVDFAPLCEAAQGLRSSDGVAVELAGAERPSSGAHIVIFRRGAVTRDTLDANPQLRLIRNDQTVSSDYRRFTVSWDDAWANGHTRIG